MLCDFMFCLVENDPSVVEPHLHEFTTNGHLQGYPYHIPFSILFLQISGGCRLEYLDKQSNVMGGPRKIRSRGSWSHIVSKATDA